ncbi:MAG: serine/threonine-protein kinase [Erythrobacter sp.]
MTDPSFERRALAVFEALLDVEEDARETWLETKTGGDVALKRRVTAIWRAEQQLNLKTGAYLDAVDPIAAPERIGAYRITETIGSGGMGTVFAAERDEGDFEHSVAIKLIKPGIFTEQLVARFNRERQILANLNHPHIARLFDGGTSELGQPYIVMERIDGVPLLDWLAAQSPSLEARLDLFLQVCAAAGHAHRNLVVHRDLTPANVLVDSAGDAKLIDFGIARPEGEEYAATLGETDASQPIRAVTMTPGYAAPERINGDAATVLSDVYSAGKMLEAMLPAAHSPELEAIIAKAIADSPDSRYLSMDELAGDVRAVLTNHPVGAMPSSKRYQWGKWFARNRALAGLGAALVVALVAGSVTTGWFWSQAVEARDDSNARFDEVRGIATFMLFDLYDELEPISGNTKALSQIADEARAYLERLSVGDDASPELQLEIAKGYHRLSTISGNPEGANLGRREDAKLFLDRALGILEQLHSSKPDDADVTDALADALYSQAIFQFIAEDDSEATIVSADRSAKLFKQLIDSDPDNDKHRFNWFKARLQAAKPYVWMDQGEKGIERLTAIVAEIKNDPKTVAGDPAARQALAAAHTELGYTRSWTIPSDRPEYLESLTDLNAALVIYDDLYENGPSENRDVIRSNLISTLFKRALVYYDLPKSQEALADIERAEEYANFLIKRDADDEGAKERLETLYSQKLFVLTDLGRHQEAVDIASYLLSVRSGRLAEDSSNTGYLRDVAGAQQALAIALDASGDRDAACREYRGSRAVWDKFVSQVELSSIDKSNNIEPLEAALKNC